MPVRDAARRAEQSLSLPKAAFSATQSFLVCRYSITVILTLEVHRRLERIVVVKLP